MSASGAKVIALRSVEFARNYGVTLHVRSSFGEGEGSGSARRTNGCWRRRSSRGHARHHRGEGDDHRRADRPGIAARVFQAARGRRRNIDMIVRRVRARLATISFTMPKTDIAVAEPILEETAREVGAQGVSRTRTSPRCP